MMANEKFTREEIEEVLSETSFQNFKRKDFQLAVDYYLDNKITDETIEFYERNIKETTEKFFQKLVEINKATKKNVDFDGECEIDTLISFLSLASLNEKKILIESPILKTLRAIPSITKIFILYTEESKERFKDLKKHLKNRDIDIEGKSINIEDLKEIYNYLQEIVKNEGLNGDNTILDSTLGLRIFGIALYKIAVERGLNVIAWRDYQLPKYEKKEDKYILTKETKRIPFLTELTLMEDPKFENAKIYRALTKELKEFNFTGAKNYYNTLGLRDFEKICQEFEQVFGLENILKLDDQAFYNSLEIALKKILNYDLEEEQNEENIRKILLKFLPLVDYRKVLAGINNFDIKIDEVDTYIEELAKRDKELKLRLYYSFVLKYLKIKLGEKALDNIVAQKIIEKLKKYQDFKTVDDMLKFFFRNYEKKNLEKIRAEDVTKARKQIENKDKLDDIFDIADDLIDDVEIPLELKKNILKISKYNLNIDLLEEEKKKRALFKYKREYVFTSNSNTEGQIKHNTIARPIVKLINGELNELNDDILIKEYGWKDFKNKEIWKGIEENEELKKTKERVKRIYYKHRCEIKNIAEFINKVVEDKLEAKGEEKRKLICIKFDKDNKRSWKTMYINEI